MEYSCKFGHQVLCTPGDMTIEADNDEEAMQQVRKFVEAGFRNETWANMSLPNDAGAYRCDNRHGKAVCELTRY